MVSGDEQWYKIQAYFYEKFSVRLKVTNGKQNTGLHRNSSGLCQGYKRHRSYPERYESVRPSHVPHSFVEASVIRHMKFSFIGGIHII